MKILKKISMYWNIMECNSFENIMKALKPEKCRQLSRTEIKEIEEKLGIQFPTSFNSFLICLGEVTYIFKGKMVIIRGKDIYQQTIDFREEFSMPQKYVVFAIDCTGNYFLFDTTKMNSKLEYKICSFNKKTEKIKEIKSNSFREFFVRGTKKIQKQLRRY